MSGVKLGRKFNRMKQAAVPAAEASTVTTPSEKTQDSQAPRLDLSHGFVRNIVYNQVIRDEYDKLVKNATDQKKSTSSRTSNSKEPMLYVPPHIRQVLQTNTTSIDMHKKDVKNPWLKLANEDSPERLAIRQRLQKEMESKKKQAIEYSIHFESLGQLDLDRHSHIKCCPASTLHSFSPMHFGKPLFLLSYRAKNGILHEHIVHSDDSAEGFAKLMARRMGLDDEDHQHRLFARLTVEMKKYEGCGCQQHS
uniref:Uncharacterized protein n=1 Tax=Parascaris univalens TaxID=6257 RepID=A0A915B0U3_PARUN